MFTSSSAVANTCSPYGMKGGHGYPQISNFLVQQRRIKRTCVLQSPYSTPRTRFSVALLGSCILSWSSNYGWRNKDAVLAWVRVVHPCDLEVRGLMKREIIGAKASNTAGKEDHEPKAEVLS